MIGEDATLPLRCRAAACAAESGFRRATFGTEKDKPAPGAARGRRKGESVAEQEEEAGSSKVLLRILQFFAVLFFASIVLVWPSQNPFKLRYCCDHFFASGAVDEIRSMTLRLDEARSWAAGFVAMCHRGLSLRLSVFGYFASNAFARLRPLRMDAFGMLRTLASRELLRRQPRPRFTGSSGRAIITLSHSSP